MEPGVVQQEVRRHRAVVRHHALFEKAPEHLPAAEHGLAVVERARTEELRQEVRGALDRTRHELRKEPDEGEERNRIARGRNLPAVDVDRVAERLKGVEAHAHRQGHLQKRDVRLEPAGAQQLDRLAEKEIVVLEHAENAEVDHAAQRKTRLRAGGARCGVRLHEAEGPAPCARERDQRKEPPVPPPVEDVARHHDKQVLEAEMRSQQPVAREHEREEHQEFG